MITRAYKVFWKDQKGNLLSSGICGSAEVLYRKDGVNNAPDWLAEKGYHLCCFDSYSHAYNYAPSQSDFEIWEVEGEKVPLQRILSGEENRILGIYLKANEVRSL